MTILRSVSWFIVIVFLLDVVYAQNLTPRACYVGPGLESRAPSFVVPCLDEGESACCALGDVCLSGNACWNFDTGEYYQYGCTDSTYQDATCPFKCGFNAALSPWTGLQYCDDIAGVINTWACLSPESCGCQWTGSLEFVNLEPRNCSAMGSDARVGLYAPATLAPYASLPQSAGGSTGYYAPLTTSGFSDAFELIQGYTPSSVTALTTYGPQPTTPVLLLPSVMPVSLATDVASPYVWDTATISLPGVLTQTTSSLSAWAPPTGLSASEPSPGRNRSGIISGSVVGSIVFIALISGVLTWCLRRRRSRVTVKRQHFRAARVWKALNTIYSASLLMAVGLLLGALFSVGHHVFYHTLNGQRVADHDWHVTQDYVLTSQEINVAAGTAFAFLVKAFLVVAIATAYGQVFWHAVKKQADRRPVLVKDLDAVFPGSPNLLTLVNFPLWPRYPLLLLLVVVAWLLPLAITITPATLSIQSLQHNNATDMAVPGLDFRSLVFSATLAGIPKLYGTFFTYAGPSLSVIRVATATALHGAVLPIPPIASNSSWEITFFGPCLQCASAETAVKTSVEQAIANYTFSASECYTPPVYASWFQNESALPLELSLNSTATSSTTIIGLFPALLKPSRQAPWNPAACAYVNETDRSNWTSPLTPDGGDDSTVLLCTLQESQYTVSFNYINGGQSIITTVSSSGNPVPILSGINATRVVDVDDASLRALSYQSVMRAFNNLVVGTIRSGLSDETPLIVNSSILTTSLLGATELSYLAPQNADSQMSSIYRSNLWQYLNSSVNSNDNPSGYAGLEPASIPSSGTPLANMIENLFQDIVVSLMSSAELLPDPNSSTYPPQVNVTITTYLNTYIYSPKKLLLAYGLAVALSAMVVGVGLTVVSTNNASYDSDFSTVMRVSRYAELSVEIKPEDGSGAKPMPEYIANAGVRFLGRVHDGKAGERRRLRHDGDETAASSLLAEEGKELASLDDNQAAAKSEDLLDRPCITVKERPGSMTSRESGSS